MLLDSEPNFSARTRGYLETIHRAIEDVIGTIARTRNNGEHDDVGRYARLKIAILKRAFKIPTLRDVSLRALSMHNGVYDTLEDVAEHYVRGGDDKNSVSFNIVRIDLSAPNKSEFTRR